MKKVFWTLVVTFFVFVIAAVIVIFTGVYNVAATVPHTRVMRWVLDETSEASVERRARDIAVPESTLSEPAVVHQGFLHYREMCVVCHGAPGEERSDIGRGLYPHPPNLAKAQSDLTAADIFWVTKNGIKMTGMPAFGPTHSDDQVWSIVAFVRRLPGMSAEEYQKMKAEAQAPSGEEGEAPEEGAPHAAASLHP